MATELQQDDTWGPDIVVVDNLADTQGDSDENNRTEP
jgi:hypothetical protein